MLAIGACRKERKEQSYTGRLFHSLPHFLVPIATTSTRVGSTRSSTACYTQEVIMKSVPSRTVTIDEAVQCIGLGQFQHKVLFATGTCFMADSVQVMLLAILSRVLQKEWGFSDTITSAITSCLFAGATIGTLILGPLGDRVGRKPVLIASATIISCFGLGTSLCNHYLALFPVTFFIGFGIGGLTVPFDILAEFLTTQTRGHYLLLIKYFWTAGSVIVPIIAYYTLEIADSWRLFSAVSIIPCLISLYTSYNYVPESPRWLVSKGYNKEALEVLRKAAKENGVDPDEVFPEGCALEDEEAEESSSFSDLFTPRWRTLTITLSVIWATYCFSFYGAIMTVTRVFVNDDDEGPDFDYFAIFISSMSELMGTAAAIQLIDRIGRVKTQVGSFIIGGFGLFLLCAFDAYADRGVLIFFALVSRACMMAGACVTWISTAELLSTEILSTGHSMVNAFARSGAFFSPYLVDSKVPMLTVGFVLLGVNLVTALCASTLLETKGVELGKAVLIEEARSQELEEEKLKEVASAYHRMKGEGSFA